MFWSKKQAAFGSDVHGNALRNKSSNIRYTKYGYMFVSETFSVHLGFRWNITKHVDHIWQHNLSLYT